MNRDSCAIWVSDRAPVFGAKLMDNVTMLSPFKKEQADGYRIEPRAAKGKQQNGPLYFPVVAIISLGSPAMMHFTPHLRLLGHGQDQPDNGSRCRVDIVDGRGHRGTSRTADESVSGLGGMGSAPTMHVDGVLRTSSLESPGAYRVHVDDDAKKTQAGRNGETGNKTGAQGDDKRSDSMKQQEDVASLHSKTAQASSAVGLLPRSLLIFKDAAYEEYLHGIMECSADVVDTSVVNTHHLHPAITSSASRSRSLKGVGQTDMGYRADMERSTEAVPEQCVAEAMPAEAGSNMLLVRTGTRISLTCRLVVKGIRRNILRL
ncbi:hypothetical protein CBR_g45547 [Chara braunii]|uniref:Alpha-ketoglutarate-dependent dioxygenase AlkB-like domain-containing protein n=1 Tax=Chara braunii TaxID=69332 RepID=A0A388LYT4_CHABU|nr:hypothetical protein CBR_g45547 [Chara braunii]|eukprot:GBG87488.1 hypothetical protein CBR_g45547 [Chara braunii]